MGWITFGSDTVMFNTFSSSFATCWGFIMGNAPDYDTLSNSNRVLGPAFFTLFSVFVFFILANMFIAIISDSFSEVHSNGKKQVKLTDEIEKTVLALVSKFKLLVLPKEQKPKRILDLLKNMVNPEILSQENVTLSEMKSAIGKDATNADARELITWHKKLRNKTKTVELKDHQSDQSDDSPVFTDDEEYNEGPQPSSPCLHGADIEQMQSMLTHLGEQMRQIQQNLQRVLELQKVVD